MPNPPKNDTPDKALVGRALEIFNGGLVKEPDAKNPRGLTMMYEPAKAMSAVIAALSQPQHGGLVEAAREAVSLIEKLRTSGHWPKNVCSASDAVTVAGKIRAALTSSDSPVVEMSDAEKADALWRANDMKLRDREAANSPVVGEETDWRHKLWMVACHATGGGIPEIAGVDRPINDICVQISAHHTAIWKQAQESALATPTPTDTADRREADPASISYLGADRREAIARIMFDASEDYFVGDKVTSDGFYTIIDALTDASLIAGSLEGFVMVPVEPTEAMLFAGDDAAAGPQDLGDGLTRAIWSAMIAARPIGDA